jgi:predicted TIM-barrel fold metal-dependent hydrolase
MTPEQILSRLPELENALAGSENEKRWAAAAELSELCEPYPDRLWPLILRHGSSADADLRQAVAANLLEHVLEHHFSDYFPLVEREVRAGNALLRETLSSSWKFGQSEAPENSARWDRLIS